MLYLSRVVKIFFYYILRQKISNKSHRNSHPAHYCKLERSVLQQYSRRDQVQLYIYIIYINCRNVGRDVSTVSTTVTENVWRVGKGGKYSLLYQLQCDYSFFRNLKKLFNVQGVWQSLSQNTLPTMVHGRPFLQHNVTTPTERAPFIRHLWTC